MRRKELKHPIKMNPAGTIHRPLCNEMEQRPDLIIKNLMIGLLGLLFYAIPIGFANESVLQMFEKDFQQVVADARPAVHHSIDEDAGRSGAPSGDRDVAASGAIAVAHPLRAGCEVDQVENLAIDQRKLENALVLNHGGEGASRCLDERARRFNRDRFSDGSNLEHGVICQDTADLNSQVADLVRPETL